MQRRKSLRMSFSKTKDQSSRISQDTSQPDTTEVKIWGHLQKRSSSPPRLVSAPPRPIKTFDMSENFDISAKRMTSFGELMKQDEGNRRQSLYFADQDFCLEDTQATYETRIDLSRSHQSSISTLSRSSSRSRLSTLCTVTEEEEEDFIQPVGMEESKLSNIPQVSTFL